MCGFVAVVGHLNDHLDENELIKATNRLLHRGPDDFGIFVENAVGLGFRRLSILDLSTDSHQPFEDANGRYVLVYNGEIYNYLELRTQLLAKGHVFRSNGDTEVLLESYKEWGRKCVEHFNGMWAFIIYDRHERSIFGARDRFGVKPLFVHDNNGRYIFGSEIKAITAFKEVRRDFNSRQVAKYLIEGRLSEPDDSWETLFAGIREIPGGHWFSIDASGRFLAHRYWSLPEQAGAEQADPADDFAELLYDSVRLRLRSDVPVGVCLSGGLDSTAVICNMAACLPPNRSDPLHAFSYIDQRFDETVQVAATVEQTKAELHRLGSSTVSFLDKLRDVLEYHDEPVHSLNVLVSFELYRMAAAHGVKVILNGQGADETWAGYPSYFLNYWYTLVMNGDVGRARQEIAEFARLHRVNPVDLWRKTLHSVYRNQLRRIAWYRKLANSRAVRAARRDDWFTEDFLRQYQVEVPEYQSLDLDTALRNSVTREPLPLYLRIEDRNSMAHSIETRLPFMDYRLVGLAFKSANQWKLRGALNKFALREATKGVIPEVVRTRIDKMGFPVSAREWFAGPLYATAREIISNASGRTDGVLSTGAVLRDLERHRQGAADFSDKLLRVMQFEMLAAQ
ncbi:MAG: asparagine synthase (glutamine-hydrolyzing) [Gammaproteobacteria bacterium]|nr:asparagine synthase (glutamine-hydrolyzing) [Gammaproteobacteria bacterium]MDH5239206.1 asparagine synthase (glutamine-hydrolyzing) [Gammaproteobacteria bacterium]MDH5259928.1 asparagine synthase (glutamine-hydrolyzing) [Gammaproteobacteria bacterium]